MVVDLMKTINWNICNHTNVHVLVACSFKGRVWFLEF